ncbi:uncharacterized protein LOC118190895 [Stegodyphus dumicola]|uniref:uncharacterized protein LOC118190895 n=1 Tax=Stegodyphus dumicola TaxID=202533 RepID=UPI0015AE6A46|nr:uncharacterized protein LOC118190895 [Stegodyphus dumicola]
MAELTDTFLEVSLIDILIFQDLRKTRIFRDRKNAFDPDDSTFIALFRVTKPITWAQIVFNKTKSNWDFIKRLGFPGVIGAVDGIHVAIVAPKDTEECQRFIYINRKSFHSLNVQLVCNFSFHFI